MQNKNKKIMLFVILGLLLIGIIDVSITANRTGHYPAITLWEDLTLNEKISSKLDGQKFETREEQKIRVEKIKEQQMEDKKNKLEEQNSKTEEKIKQRITNGEFTEEEYSRFYISLLDENKNLQPEEIIELDRKLAEGKINIHDYID